MVSIGMNSGGLIFKHECLGQSGITTSEFTM